MELKTRQSKASAGYYAHCVAVALDSESIADNSGLFKQPTTDHRPPTTDHRLRQARASDALVSRQIAPASDLGQRLLRQQCAHRHGLIEAMFH